MGMGRWFYGPAGIDGWLGMGIGMVLQLLFWVVIIYVAVRLLRGVSLGRSCGGGFFSSNQLSAKDILKQRYAKGEITREQYKEMINDIEEGNI